jgi:hypothetical protein
MLSVHNEMGRAHLGSVLANGGAARDTAFENEPAECVAVDIRLQGDRFTDTLRSSQSQRFHG